MYDSQQSAAAQNESVPPENNTAQLLIRVFDFQLMKNKSGQPAENFKRQMNAGANESEPLNPPAVRQKEGYGANQYGEKKSQDHQHIGTVYVF